ncbi:MAG: hypothetical protein AB7D57_13220 [Desulfovibrionaceae bacterium]
MILCTRCGASNPDDAWTCARCGRKLQSLRRPDEGGEDGEGSAEGAGRAGRAFPEPWSGPDPAWRKVFWQCLEVCALGAALLAAVGWGLFTRTWWPAGAVSLLAALRLGLRRKG